jgi:hypothetical protein
MSTSISSTYAVVGVLKNASTITEVLILLFLIHEICYQIFVPCRVEIDLLCYNLRMFLFLVASGGVSSKAWRSVCRHVSCSLLSFAVMMAISWGYATMVWASRPRSCISRPCAVAKARTPCTNINTLNQMAIISLTCLERILTSFATLDSTATRHAMTVPTTSGSCWNIACCLPQKY